jgi:PAS domain S-box-containing protein
MATERGTDGGAQADAAASPESRAVFDLVNDGVLVLDADTGAILDANRRAEVMYARSREALRGSTVDSLSEGHAPFNQCYAMALVRRAAAGQPQLFEWRARRSSGESFWVEVNLSRVRIDDTDRLIAVVRDITERKRVEDALRDSEDRSRRRAEELAAALAEVKRLGEERALAVDVLEHGDAVLVLDADYRIVLVNENQERLSRRSREELLGRAVWEVFPEAASAGGKYRTFLERVMKERVPESFDEYYRPLDLWTAVSAYPTRQGGIAVFIRDVTERERAEAALRDQQAFASRVLASSLNGLYVVDTEAEEPVFVNARYTQLTGYTLADLRAFGGQLIGRLFHPDDRVGMRAHLAALMRARDGEVLDVEYRFLARDGRWISCFSRETPFARHPDGRVRQLIGTFVDVTELRRAESAVVESEARYRALFESMTEGFALLEVVDDLEGHPVDARYVEVNPAFERLTGIPRASVIGRRLGDVSDSSEFWIRTYGQVAATGEPVRVEYWSTVLARDYDVVAFSPRPRQFAVLFLDVTDRKRIERELRDADRRSLAASPAAAERG